MAILIGKKAPHFSASAVVGGVKVEDNFSLDQYVGKQYVLFFFYPADFSGLCPTELLAFQEMKADFESRNTVVVGCSVDSKFVHQRWLTTSLSEGGIQGVSYPIVADASMTIAQNYGVLAGEYSYNEQDDVEFHGAPMAYRAWFLIDKNGIVRHQLVNDLPLGRNTQEALRTLDALQYVEEFGEGCPANWHKK